MSKNLKTKKRRIEVWYDGACEPVNPGGHAGGGYLIKEQGKEINRGSHYIAPGPNTSNNVAEYRGVLSAMQWLLENGFDDDHIQIYGDNMMSVKQLAGEWRALKGRYLPLYREARALALRFSSINFKWIPREQNSEADEISKQVLIDNKVKFRIQPQ